MLDAFYAQKAERDRSKELAGQVLKVLHNELKKDRRKVKKLKQQLDDAAKADYYSPARAAKPVHINNT